MHVLQGAVRSATLWLLHVGQKDSKKKVTWANSACQERMMTYAGGGSAWVKCGKCSKTFCQKEGCPSNLRAHKDVCKGS